MKTSVFIAFLGLVLGLSLFLAPSADALVMVKNYTRYNATFEEPAEYLGSIKPAASEERPRFTGWKSIFNIFVK